MSAAFSNAEVGDDGDLVIHEPARLNPNLLVVAALLVAALLAWLVFRK